MFGRFEAVWTPTVLIMSPKGVERWRMEGYQARDEFKAWLEMGLGRVAFMAKRFPEAEVWYRGVGESKSLYAPEALYWQAVCKYKATNDHSSLPEIADVLYQSFPGSIWTMKANPWLPAEHPANRVLVP